MANDLNTIGAEQNDANWISFKSKHRQTLRGSTKTECWSVMEWNRVDQEVIWRQLYHPDDDDQWPHTSKMNRAHHCYTTRRLTSPPTNLRQWYLLVVWATEQI